MADVVERDPLGGLVPPPRVPRPITHAWVAGHIAYGEPVNTLACDLAAAPSTEATFSARGPAERIRVELPAAPRYRWDVLGTEIHDLPDRSQAYGWEDEAYVAPICRSVEIDRTSGRHTFEFRFEAAGLPLVEFKLSAPEGRVQRRFRLRVVTAEREADAAAP